jgi:DNA helicase-2/ATP-dependent DNA helicase PcrA
VEQIEKFIGGTSYFSLDSGRASSQDEHENLGFGDIAVLFRLNAQGDAFEEAFSRAGIPFVRSGEKPLIEGFPINVIWRFLQTLAHPENGYYSETYLSLLRKYNLTPSTLTNTSYFSLAGENEGGGRIKVIELIDQAVAMHGFEELPEEEGNRLRRLNDLATSFHGDLSSFLDALSLERGIDHAGLTRCERP